MIFKQSIHYPLAMTKKLQKCFIGTVSSETLVHYILFEKVLEIASTTRRSFSVWSLISTVDFTKCKSAQQHRYHAVPTIPWHILLSCFWLISTWTIFWLPSGSEPHTICSRSLRILQGKLRVNPRHTRMVGSIMLQVRQFLWSSVPSWVEIGLESGPMWHFVRGYGPSTYTSIMSGLG